MSKLDNKTVYKKTLVFSIRRLLWDIVAFGIFAIATIIGFVVLESATNRGLIGLLIGAVIGLIIVGVISHFFGYKNYAGQIAMMTKAVTEDELPEDIVAEGKKVVSDRFATVSAYYLVTGVIKGIFNQLGRGITAVGEAVGGDTGGTIGSAISSVIQVIVAYLCDCCLGWVFYRKDKSSGKATLEGAVLFFKHGKTLAKNLGRIFGMGIISFLLIGGVFTGIFYLIFGCFPDFFSDLSSEIVEAASRTETNIPEFVSNVSTLTLACATICGITLWCMIHSTFVRPFILVGVLRNFMEAGMNDIPSETDFNELDGKSAKFKKLHEKVSNE